jgi:hypothetical protein
MKPSTIHHLNLVSLDPAAPVLNAIAAPDALNHPIGLLEGTPIGRNADWKSAAEVQAPVQPLDAVAWVEALAHVARPVARS